MLIRRSKLTASVLSLASLVSFLATNPVHAFTLTLLHNNDGESRLLNAGTGREDFGGVARFATVIQNLRAEAAANTSGSLLISSGDNFLAGPQFDVSLQRGVPFFDSLALELIGYDAVTLGNHEFDFGPDVLADFIAGFDSPIPFLSANLDFSNEPRLQAFVDAPEGPRIARSAIFEINGERVGVIGATTPRLPDISSPRNVGVSADVAGAIQAEVNALKAQGVNKIIVSSHLQNIQEELALVPLLSGVDVVIAGGGEQLLADESTLLIPGDNDIFGPYPLLQANDADGRVVPVVTTPGNYTYVGRLIVEFDPAGNVVSIGDASGLVRVAGGSQPDAVQPDPIVQTRVVEPVEAAVAQLAETVIGSTVDSLDGARETVRTQETNLGNLVADSLLWQANQLAGGFGLGPAQVAIQNGGGIRAGITADVITELETFTTLAFANFVSIVPNVAASQFKELLEHAVSGALLPEGDALSAEGRFAQIAGFQMGIEIQSEPGNRVKQVVLNDGTVIVRDGQVIAGAPELSIATIDFLARGGDAYPFEGVPFTTLGVTYRQAFVNYVQQALGGTVDASEYALGTNERIFFGEVPNFPEAPAQPPVSVPEPGSLLGLLALGAIGAGSRWKPRRQ